MSGCWTCSRARAGTRGTSQRPGAAKSTRTPTPETGPEASSTSRPHRSCATSNPKGWGSFEVSFILL